MSDDPEVIGNPDLAVPYTGTSGYEYPPPPPPEGYTLDQWIAERALRAQEHLARANERLADEMRDPRRGIDPDLDYDVSTPKPDSWWTPREFVPDAPDWIERHPTLMLFFVVCATLAILLAILFVQGTLR